MGGNACRGQAVGVAGVNGGKQILQKGRALYSLPMRRWSEISAHSPHLCTWCLEEKRLGVGWGGERRKIKESSAESDCQQSYETAGWCTDKIHLASTDPGIQDSSPGLKSSPSCRSLTSPGSSPDVRQSGSRRAARDPGGSSACGPSPCGCEQEPHGAPAGSTRAAGQPWRLKSKPWTPCPEPLCSAWAPTQPRGLGQSLHSWPF